VAAWLRADLPEFASELLSESELRRTGYFDPAAVARLVSQHRSGQHDWGHRLMGVLVMQLWDQIFLRGNGPLL